MTVPITLERIPHNKQVEVHGLLAQGFPYRRIAKLVGISTGSITSIARHQPSNPEHVEMFKKALIGRAYAIGSRAFDFVTDSKLDSCSAPQLMMVAGVAIDKARDMEGSNRPVFNVVTVINECKQTRDKLESQMATIQRARTMRSSAIISTQTPSDQRSDLI